MVTHENIQLTLFGGPTLDEMFPDTDVISTGFSVESQVYGLAWETAVLPTLAAAHDVDILFCPNGNAPLRRSKVPVVTWLHDVFAYRGESSGLYTQLQQRRLPRVVACSDVIATVSQFSRNQIAETFDRQPADIELVPNAIDPTFFADDDGTAVAVPDEYILFVGGANKRKNFEGLVHAFKRIHDRTDGAYELVVTGPSKKQIYESTGVDLNHPAITNRGFVSQSELKYLYRNASLFLYPSLKEGFGLPPLEAMAGGTPVVSSEKPCMPEVLGDAAVFADPKDPDDMATKAITVLTDSTVQARLVEKGHARADRYTWSKTIDTLREVFADQMKRVQTPQAAES